MLSANNLAQGVLAPNKTAEQRASNAGGSLNEAIGDLDSFNIHLNKSTTGKKKEGLRLPLLTLTSSCYLVADPVLPSAGTSLLHSLEILRYKSEDAASSQMFPSTKAFKL
jgi:hypothetical protein